MIKYRPQRGGLVEAMAEAKQFETIEEMIDYIYNDHAETWGQPMFDREDLSIEDPPHGDDNRIGWKNVRYILTNRYGNEDYIELFGHPCMIGYCSY